MGGACGRADEAELNRFVDSLLSPVRSMCITSRYTTRSFSLILLSTQRKSSALKPCPAFYSNNHWEICVHLVYMAIWGQECTDPTICSQLVGWQSLQDESKFGANKHERKNDWHEVPRNRAVRDLRLARRMELRCMTHLCWPLLVVTTDQGRIRTCNRACAVTGFVDTA